MYCVVGRVMDISIVMWVDWRVTPTSTPIGEEVPIRTQQEKKKGKQADIFSLMKSLPTGSVVTLVQPPTYYPDLNFSYVGCFCSKSF